MGHITQDSYFSLRPQSLILLSRHLLGKFQITRDLQTTPLYRVSAPQIKRLLGRGVYLIRLQMQFIVRALLQFRRRNVHIHYRTMETFTVTAKGAPGNGISEVSLARSIQHQSMSCRDHPYIVAHRLASIYFIANPALRNPLHQLVIRPRFLPMMLVY